MAASAPLQPPEAVHEVALIEVQVSADAAPLATDAGFAVSVTVGMTLIPCLTTGLVPPAPVQVMTNVEFCVSGPVL